MLLSDRHQASHVLVRPADELRARSSRESLSAQAKSLYRSLLRKGGVPYGELPVLTAATSAAVQSALEELKSLGLVESEHGRVTAVLYRDVVDALLGGQGRILENALAEVREVQWRLRVLLRESAWLSGDSAGTVLSTSACNNEADRHMYEARTHPQAEMAAMHPGARFSPELLSNSLMRAKADLAQGIRLRVVHQTTALSHPQSAEYLSQIEQLGGQVRLRRNLPFRLILIDGETAVCRMQWQDGFDETLLLQGTRMLGLLGRLFETTWVDSTPLNALPQDFSEDLKDEYTGPTPTLTGQHKAIIRHLADGSTDQVIAHSLGITTRTVTRRMNEIYEALGVQSRFQAGAVARRMGLI